jgi:hypothetical protein
LHENENADENADEIVIMRKRNIRAILPPLMTLPASIARALAIAFDP